MTRATVLTGEQAQLVFVSIAAQAGRGPIALPVDTPLDAASIAEEGGVDVVWTKRSPASLLDEAHANTRLAGGGPPRRRRVPAIPRRL